MSGSLPEKCRGDTSPARHAQDQQQLGEVIRKPADSVPANRRPPPSCQPQTALAASPESAGGLSGGRSCALSLRCRGARDRGEGGDFFVVGRFFLPPPSIPKGTLPNNGLGPNPHISPELRGYNRSCRVSARSVWVRVWASPSKSRKSQSFQ
jgi:hypothetical protein